MKWNSRPLVGMLAGAGLGVFCIIGVSLRLGFAGNELFILATYINRIIMGLVIGLLPFNGIEKKRSGVLLRGAFFGFLISGSLHIATDFRDLPGFLAGVAYGVIIDLAATRYGKR